MRITPPSISSSPATARSRVDLPQPDGPTTTQKAPSSTVRSMASSAAKAPKRRLSLSTVSDATSSLDRAGDEAVDDSALQRQHQRDERQSRGEGRSGDLAPRHRILAREESDPDRQRPLRRVREDEQREEGLVPRMDEDEDCSREEARGRQRSDDAAEGGEAGATVEPSRVFEVRGKVFEEARGEPHGERQRQRD